MRKIFASLSVVLFIVLSCKKENRFIDENGNEFIKKGDELFIIPAEYEKTGKSYKVFIYNETLKDVSITKDLKIKPNQFKVIHMKDTDTLRFDIGVKFMFGDEYGLEVEDKKSQILGLGGEFLDKYGVPDEAEWAFVIVPPGEG